MLVHAECLACDLVALRCVLDGHVKISHLIYAQQDRYLSLLANVYVGNHRWLSVEVQLESPVNLGLSTLGKGEPCVARDEVVSPLCGVERGIMS